jgi:hypothetical protein
VKGSPLNNMATFLLCYLPLALPLYWVTKDQGPVASTSPLIESEAGAASTRAQPARLLIQSAHPWEHLTVLINGKVILESKETIRAIDFYVEEYDFDEISLNVKWTKDTPETAIRVEMQPDFLESQSHTTWGYQTLREEIIFQWNHE